MKIKTRIARVARRSSIAALVLDERPVTVTFWDGSRRRVPRRLARLFSTWRSSGVEEARTAYEAFDGGDIIDVGAFEGFYSLLLAPKALPGSFFLSLEPDGRAHPALFANLATATSLFPGVRFAALPAAAGNGGEITMHLPSGEAGHPRFAAGPDAPHAGGIATLRIDDVVSTLGLRPRFMKIDVEGAELQVLQGSLRTLETARPIVILEIHPLWQTEPGALEAIKQIALQYSFNVLDLDVGSFSVRQLWTPK
jgi:FkbM family methyltransferase